MPLPPTVLSRIEFGPPEAVFGLIVVIPFTRNAPVTVAFVSVVGPITFNNPPSVVPPPTCRGPPVTLREPIIVVLESCEDPPLTTRDPPVIFTAPVILVFCNVVGPYTVIPDTTAYFIITTPEPPAAPGLV